MSDRRSDLPHGRESIRVRQLHLHLSVSPFAPGAFEGNDGFGRKSPCQIDLAVREREHSAAEKRHGADQLIASPEERH
jgi:hypothetical protein